LHIVFAAVENGGAKITQTILRGVDAEPTPYFALILTPTKFCGGVLIFEDLVLSSASCTERYSLETIHQN